MPRVRRNTNRSATERLRLLIETALKQQDITSEEAAREAKLPSNAFRSLLRRGHRPTLDRADELCRAIGTSMTIGAKRPETDTEQKGGRERT